MFSSKASLGIEIRPGRVSVALVGQAGGKLRVLKADSADPGDGVIVGGAIVDAVRLGKCLRKLLRSNGINHRKACVSLVANSSLLQIVELPVGVPENIGQFVRSEIRHSRLLSSKEYCFDYCGLGAGGVDGNARLIVAAIDSRKFSRVLRSLAIAGVEPVSVSPAMLGWVGAMYRKYVASNYDSNVLFAISDDISIRVCVFRKGKLDFVRTVEIPIGLKAQEYLDNFVNELKSVRQYYDIEVSPLEDRKWKTVVEVNSGIISSDEVRDYFAGAGDDVNICSCDNAGDHISIEVGKSVKTVSIAAVGLAAEGFGKDDMHIGLNLVPDSVRKAKNVRRAVFAAACMAAAVLNFILISSDLMGPRFAEAEEMVKTARENLDLKSVSKLSSQKTDIERQIANLSQRHDFMSAVRDMSSGGDWSKLLTVLVERSPSDLCIVSLRQKNDRTVEIGGKVSQYKSAYAFANSLDESDYFASAVLTDVHRDTRFEGLIDYSINCEIRSSGSIEPDGN